MGDIISFGMIQREKPEIEAMDREELLAYLETLRERISALDGEEPDDMESEAYEGWGDAHEELEDLVDEVVDRLEELEEEG